MEYKDTEFMSVKEKELTTKQFKNFVKKLSTSGWGNETQKSFTKRVYEHLHLNCGFIAHYDISGFYNTYFNGDLDDYLRFSEAFIEDGEIKPYQYTQDYNDINLAFSKILHEKHERILSMFSDDTKERDLAEVRRLNAKWD